MGADFPECTSYLLDEVRLMRFSIFRLAYDKTDRPQRPLIEITDSANRYSLLLPAA